MKSSHGWHEIRPHEVTFVGETFKIHVAHDITFTLYSSWATHVGNDILFLNFYWLRNNQDSSIYTKLGSKTSQVKMLKENYIVIEWV